MIKFNLADLSKRKGSSVVLPEIQEGLGSRRSYLAILRRMLKAISAEVSRDIISRYEQEQSFERSFKDAAPDDSWFTSLAQAVELLTGAASAMVDRVLNIEATNHTKKWMRTTSKALGINMEMLVKKEDLDDYLRAAARRNSTLIKSLGTDAIERVERETIAAYLRGDRPHQLVSILKKEFGALDNRAKLIAYDQLSKLNADMNRIRHEQGEIEEYIWSTSADERVRPLHKAINGRKYRYDEPTDAEGGQHAGQPIRCRCVARAVVEW